MAKDDQTDQPPAKEHLVRKPCLNDPAYWDACKERITTEVSIFDEYGPIAYDVGDEQSPPADDGLCELRAEPDIPGRPQLGRHGRGRRAATGRIVSIRRPVIF